MRNQPPGKPLSKVCRVTAGPDTDEPAVGEIQVLLAGFLRLDQPTQKMINTSAASTM